MALEYAKLPNDPEELKQLLLTRPSIDTLAPLQQQQQEAKKFYDEREKKVVRLIDSKLRTYRELREEDERFIDTVRRLGLTPFRERAYAAHPAAA